MAFTEKALGEALGQLYCAKYFDESAKERAAAIVENVRQALEERLKEVEWMASETTREEALKKMSHFRVKIGYPNKWIDYSTLVFETDDSFLTMVRKARAFAHNRVVTDMNAPTDRERWFLTPQTVNAYYHPGKYKRFDIFACCMGQFCKMMKSQLTPRLFFSLNSTE